MSDNYTYVCPKCRKQMESGDALESHLEKEHGVKAKYAKLKVATILKICWNANVILRRKDENEDLCYVYADCHDIISEKYMEGIVTGIEAANNTEKTIIIYVDVK